MADMFLKLTDVEGESLDAKHEGEIEIHDWVWRVYNSAPFRLYDVAEATKLGSADHITIHKMFDKASATLMKICAHGQHIEKGLITCRKNDGDKKFDYLTIELTDIKIDEVGWLGKGDNNIHAEHVELSFFKVRVLYTTQVVIHDPKPGEPAPPLNGPIEFHFDIPQKGQPAKQGK